MTGNQFCKNCGTAGHCRQVYQQLSKAKCSPVARRSVVAFLLPITVFIVAAAAFQKLLAATALSQTKQTAVAFALAATVVFMVMVVTRFTAARLPGKRLQDKTNKNSTA
jgi:uncharacterized membrane protein (DUF485 family)